VRGETFSVRWENEPLAYVHVWDEDYDLEAVVVVSPQVMQGITALSVDEQQTPAARRGDVLRVNGCWDGKRRQFALAASHPVARDLQVVAAVGAVRAAALHAAGEAAADAGQYEQACNLHWRSLNAADEWVDQLTGGLGSVSPDWQAFEGRPKHEVCSAAVRIAFFEWFLLERWDGRILIWPSQPSAGVAERVPDILR
jgi:hypothetical protein